MPRYKRSFYAGSAYRPPYMAGTRPFYSTGRRFYRTPGVHMRNRMVRNMIRGYPAPLIISHPTQTYTRYGPYNRAEYARAARSRSRAVARLGMSGAAKKAERAAFIDRSVRHEASRTMDQELAKLMKIYLARENQPKDDEPADSETEEDIMNTEENATTSTAPLTLRIPLRHGAAMPPGNDDAEPPNKIRQL